MAEEPPQISIIDARLAEIDRRLGAIQTGLAVQDAPAEPEAAEAPPTGEPGPSEPEAAEPTANPEPEAAEPTANPEPEAAEPPPPPEPEPAEPELPPRVEVDAPPSDPPPQGAALLDELRRLATAHERVLESTRQLLAAYERALASLPPNASSTVREFSVSAGPFQSTEALRGFERTLAKIPEVREVTVRGYEGEDRAIVDVHLIDPTS
ncbi:MAG TPA: hypothetical protein VGL51_10065 [Solirubrobacteraceae bacterium]|jgi:hypothetical protein